MPAATGNSDPDVQHNDKAEPTNKITTTLSKQAKSNDFNRAMTTMVTSIVDCRKLPTGMKPTDWTSVCDEVWATMSTLDSAASSTLINAVPATTTNSSTAVASDKQSSNGSSTTIAAGVAGGVAGGACLIGLVVWFIVKKRKKGKDGLTSKSGRGASSKGKRRPSADSGTSRHSGEGSDDGSEAGEAKSYYNKRNSFGGGSDAGSSDADGRSSLGDQRRSNRDTMASDGPSFNDRTSIGGSSRGGDDDDDDGRSMSGGIRGRGSFESDGGRSDVGSDAGSDVDALESEKEDLAMPLPEHFAKSDRISTASSISKSSATTSSYQPYRPESIVGSSYDGGWANDTTPDIEPTPNKVQHYSIASNHSPYQSFV